MAEVKKPTEQDRYNELIQIVEASDSDNKEDLVAFINKKIDALTRKREKAAEANAKKRAESDELLAKVKELLTGELQTIEDVLDQLSDVEEITKAKVTSRLSKLVKEGVADKQQVKGADGRRVVAYKLAE